MSPEPHDLHPISAFNSVVLPSKRHGVGIGADEAADEIDRYICPGGKEKQLGDTEDCPAQLVFRTRAF